MKVSSKDIAVVGMACRFAGANSMNEFWENALEGVQSFSEFPKERWNHDLFHSDRSRALDKTYVKKGAFIDDVDKFPALEFGIAPKRVEVMDPQHRLALEVTRDAIQDASLFRDDFDPARVGTFLGVLSSEYRNLTVARSQATFLAGGELGESDPQALSDAVVNAIPISAFTMPGTLLNMNAANIARHWGFSGPAFTLDAACTSSLLAIHNAITHIRSGSCSVAIAGGVYLNLTPESLVGFSRIGAISKSGECRPFDEKADGFLQGEGCGIVVLKKLEDAIRAGDRIYSVIKGAATNNDAGRSAGPMAPSLEGQIEVLRNAYKDADIDPRTIGFVSCHGTATPVGDPVEVGALRALIKDADHSIYLSSIKANIGHTMGAAGVAGFIHANLSLFHKKITPQAGFEKLHPALEISDTPFEISQKAQDWLSTGKRRAGTSAFGFGGTNCHVVIEEFEATTASSNTSEMVKHHTIVVSASNADLLSKHAHHLAHTLDGTAHHFEDIVKTLNEGRKVEKTRLAIVASNVEKLVSELTNAGGLLAKGTKPGRLSADCFWGIKEEDAKVAFLFPGQGAQRVGLFADLFETNSIFRDALLGFDPTIEASCGESIESLLYPKNPTSFHSERLKRTEICQPVMAAIGLSLCEVLHHYEVDASVFFGHSLGEFVATGAAGLVDPHEIVEFVAERGRLMAALPGEHGAMAAVMAPVTEVKKYLTEGVVIANINHPTQTVISGRTKDVEDVLSLIEGAGLRAIPLRVSHAFHSPLVEGISEGLREAAKKLGVNETAKKVRSSTKNAFYDTEVVEHFVNHTTSPVDFLGTLNAVFEEGVTTFIELGAGTTLTSFVQGSLPRDQVNAFSLGDKKPDEGKSFARALAQMVVAGIDIKFSSNHKKVISLPPSPLAKKRYWAWREKKANLSIPGVKNLRKGKGTKPDKELQKRNRIMKNTTPQSDSDLISLFREQADILRQHANILAAQTAALSQSGIIPAEISEGLRSSEQNLISPKSLSKDVRAKDIVEVDLPDVDVESIVFTSIESVSAFPLSSLKLSQNLVSDLGFDSLMFVDLVSDLQEKVPGLVIAQSAFDQKTSIQDVIDYLENAEEDQILVNLDNYPLEVYERKFLPMVESSWEFIPLPGRPTLVGDTPIVSHLADAFSESRVVKWGDTLEGNHVIIGMKSKGDLKEKLVHLIRTFQDISNQKVGDQNPRFVQVVCDNDDLANAFAISSFVKSMHLELEAFCSTIVTDNPENIPKEAFMSHGFPLVEIRKGKAFVESRERVKATQGGARIGPTDTVLITGGTGALGRVVAESIIKEIGASVVLCGRRKEGEVREVITALGDKASYLSWDISKPADDKSAEILSQISVIVHCAGLTKDKILGDLSNADIDPIIAPKISGLKNVIAACESLKQVINFSSWASHFGNSGQAIYAAANGCLDGFSSPRFETLSMCWPIWSGEGMGAKLSEAMKVQLQSQGVTFLSVQEGVTLFINEVKNASSAKVLVIGRGLSETDGSPRFSQLLDFQTHPFMKDHVLKGESVYPFASALENLVEASFVGRGFQAFQVKGMTLVNGIKLGDERLDLEIESVAKLSGSQVNLSADKVLSYRAFVADFPEKVHGLPTIPEVLLDSKVEMDLVAFYKTHSFHGPLLQSISEVMGVGENAIRGKVKTSHPQEWIPSTKKNEWFVDPKVIDGALQLVLYFLKSQYQKSAYPISMERLVLLRPFRGEISCTMVLETKNDEFVEGSLFFEDNQGMVAWIETLKAKIFVDEKPTEKIADLRMIAPKSKEKAKKEIEEKHYIIKKFPEVEELSQRLQMAELMGLENPYFRPHTGPARGIAMVEGKEMMNYSSYNYLGFSGHPEVTKQVIKAVEDFGSSASASRIASGQIPIHAELEYELASVVGTESALVFSAGHMTNETVIGHIFGPKDLIIHDALAHNSILTGAELSGAKRMSFPHSDADALESILDQLRDSYEKVGVFIEGVYSMDGDIPNLPRFIEVKKKYKTLLYVDEAHSIGVIGKTGCGLREFWDVDAADVDVWMGTLSKAFASCGGYVAASSSLIEYLKYTAPAFVFSAGISPANTAAALASIRGMKASPETVKKLQDNCAYFLKALKEENLDTGMSENSAVIPVIIRDSLQSLQLADRLSKRGINVQPIFYPAVDDSESRLRFFLSSTHTEAQLSSTAKIVAEEFALVRSDAAAE